MTWRRRAPRSLDRSRAALCCRWGAARRRRRAAGGRERAQRPGGGWGRGCERARRRVGAARRSAPGMRGERQRRGAPLAFTRSAGARRVRAAASARPPGPPPTIATSVGGRRCDCMLAAGGRGRDLSLLAACWRSLGALKGAQTVSKFQGRRLRKRQGREAPPVRLRGQAAPGAAPGEIEDYAIEARHAFSSTQEARLPPLHLADTVRLAEQVQSKQARVNASWCALTARLLWPDRRFGVGYSTPLTAAAAHPQETGEKSQHSRYRKAALPAAAGACR